MENKEIITASFTELTSDETSTIDGGRITAYDIGYYSHAVCDKIGDALDKLPHIHFM